ncbi:hypothetical protein KSP40_PGU014199 [Platanthera guangdongensis]|uniref:KIB1-4 beta-propeller domain-containing protein n=1 Tax=Platanthera guangdongensis TaxID=2320717 RepID=A0ABR2LL21_9ASPA
MACSTFAADWRNLVPEIVLSMAEQLVVADIIRLRSVCINWARALGRSSSMRPLSAPPRAGNLSFFQPSPWLFLPKSIAHANSKDCAFYSIIEDRLYKFSSLPQLTGRNLLGTSQYGWLVTIDNLRLTPHFFNPLTKLELPLPSLMTIPSFFVPRYSPKDGSLLGLWYNDVNSFYFPKERFFGLVKICVKKITLTSPARHGSIAIILFTTDDLKNCLSFARVGGEAWSPYLKLPANFDSFEDVVFNEENNKIYALTNLGAVFILECRNNSIEVLSMVSMRIRETSSALMKRYMFFSSGDLMQVTWNLHLMCSDVGVGSTEGYVDATIFKIFKFDPTCYNRHDPQITDVREIKKNPNLCPYASCWVAVNDLGGRSLFIGSNNCFIIDCGDEQKRNKVFFLYDLIWLDHISQVYGAYDLKSNEIERLNPPIDRPSECLPTGGEADAQLGEAGNPKH